MAATTAVGSIKKYFRRLKDPRVVGRSRHLLVDIIVLAICGVIADCDDWSEIVLFGQKRLAWLHAVTDLLGLGNQERLLEDVQATVERALNDDLPGHVVL